ncbi:MAG: AAA family ATPase [Hyphomicrobium sp. 32-62-53]|nr:MAG: AAA family ATPase [Hyphomicrobium sp. 12-62-95]OYY01758.1 MAG: AAA family ATPase [Hyphomicrobium sp. 32-62-53]
MSLRIITADMRRSAAMAKTTLAILGPSGSGKTCLMKALPGRETLCLDFEAGLMSVQEWDGDSIPIRNFEDARDIACLIGGVNPAADPQGYYSQGHYAHVTTTYPELAALVASKRYIFVDSLTDLTRQAMAWAKQQPEAISERTGKPDVRGAYGLLAREVITLLKHLQHADGKTTIYVAILECVTDEFNRSIWQPQLEGGKVARELSGIVDQVATLSLFEPEGDGWRHDPIKGRTRRLVCQTANPYGLPAKDRSGKLDVTEPADLLALLTKIHAHKKG